MQRADDAEVGEPVQRRQPPHAQGRLAVADRADAVRPGVLGVDGGHALVDVGLDRRVAVERRPRRHRDLDERQLAVEPRPPGEQRVEGAEALGYPLGVVEAVDAHPDERGVDAQLAAQPVLLGLEGRRPGHRLDAVVVHADGHRADGHGAAPDLEPAAGPPRAELGPRRGQEVAPVALELEREEVAVGQPLEDLAAIGADAQLVGVGERDVPEQGDPRSRPELPQEPRHQGQVVVLHEDRGGDVRQLGVDGVGEAAVHALVDPPVLGPEHRLDVGDVAERPQPLVGEPLVVVVLLGLGQPDAPQIVGRRIGGDPHPVVVVDGQPVGVAGPVRDPDPPALAHQGVEGHRDPAGGRRPRDAPVLGARMDVRLAVGHHDQRARESRLAAASVGLHHQA